MKCARARCVCPATKDRDDGLCWRHRRIAKESARQIAQRRARPEQPKRGRPKRGRPAAWFACSRCNGNRRALRDGVCGRCLQLARTAARPAAANAALPLKAAAPLCSVSGCRRGRELERTCIEHAPRFDQVRPARTLRAENFAVRTRDPREGA